MFKMAFTDSGPLALSGHNLKPALWKNKGFGYQCLLNFSPWRQRHLLVKRKHFNLGRSRTRIFHVSLQLRDLFQEGDVSINTRCPLCFNLSKQLLKGGTNTDGVYVCVTATAPIHPTLQWEAWTGIHWHAGAFQAVLCFHLQKQNKHLNLHIEWKKAAVLCLRVSTRHSGFHDLTLKQGVTSGRLFFPWWEKRKKCFAAWRTRVSVDLFCGVLSSLRAFEVNEWVDLVPVPVLVCCRPKRMRESPSGRSWPWEVSLTMGQASTPAAARAANPASLPGETHEMIC